MFLKQGIFKKLLTEQYKGNGIRIWQEEEWLFVAGDYWTVEMRKDKMPNKIKGLLVEFAGDMPKENEIITCIKNCDNDVEEQYGEINDFRNCTSRDDAELCILSNVGVNGFNNLYRVVQGVKTREAGMLNEKIVQAIDKKEMDEMETWIAGPIKAGRIVLWESTECAVMAFLHTPTEETFQPELMRVITKEIALDKVQAYE